MTEKENLPCESLTIDRPGLRVPSVGDGCAEKARAGLSGVRLGETLTGEPMPDVADVVRRSRQSH